MSYTKGPWSHHYDVIYSESSERNIGELYPHGSSHDDSILDELDKEDEATRALIVAAPDLLAACEAALTGWEQGGDVWGPMQQLKAAIAKARGNG